MATARSAEEAVVRLSVHSFFEDNVSGAILSIREACRKGAL